MNGSHPDGDENLTPSRERHCRAQKPKKFIFLGLAKFLVFPDVLADLQRCRLIEIRFDGRQDVLVVIGNSLPFHIEAEFAQVSDATFGVSLIGCQYAELGRANWIPDVAMRNRNSSIYLWFPGCAEIHCAEPGGLARAKIARRNKNRAPACGALSS